MDVQTIGHVDEIMKIGSSFVGLSMATYTIKMKLMNKAIIQTLVFKVLIAQELVPSR